MKRAAAVAAMMGLLAIPAMAQHGGAHGGGFGGHAVSGGFAGHGGFGGSAPHFGGFAPRSVGGGFAPHAPGFAPRGGPYTPRYGGFVPRGFVGPGRPGFAPRPGMSRMPYRGNWYGRGGNTYGREGGDHHRRPYDRGFNGYVNPYVYGVYLGYPYDIDPWLSAPDWYDSDDYDNSGQGGDYGGVPAPYANYGEPDYGQPAYPPQGYQPYSQVAPEPYQPQSTPGASLRRPYTGDSDASESQATVTLIFKDGRAPEKIHNYLLTASTLTVLDAPYRKIPLDQIDVPATAEFNRPAGIRFQVPGAEN